MENDHTEIAIIVLATSVVLLLVMITLVVIEIEKNMFEETESPTNEKEITNNNELLKNGLYYNTSDIENKTNLKFNKDGSFIFNYNTCTESKRLTGAYQIDDNYIYLTLLDDTDLEKEFTLVKLNDDILEYRGKSIGCSPFEYSVFILK